MVEIVVRKIVDRDTLRRQAVPVVEFEREQRRHRIGLEMAEIMPPDLAGIIRQPIRKRRGFRQQQQAHVFISIARQQHHVGRLEIFLAALDVGHPAGAAAALVDLDAGGDRLRHHAAGAWSPSPSGWCYRGRVLGADMAAAAVAEAVILAARPVVIGFRIDRRRSGERMPAELARRLGHALGEFGAAQRRHRVGAFAGAFENIAARIDGAADIAGLARYPDRVLDLVVIGLEFLEPERPVFDRSSPSGCGRPRSAAWSRSPLGNPTD